MELSGPLSQLYTLAFNFWSLLTTQQEHLPGGVALANLEVPFLLANAAWYPRIGQLQSIAAWYSKRGLPPAVIVPSVRDEDLERTLQEGPFMLEQRFCFSRLEPNSFLKLNTRNVEQAGWLQSRTSAELLAAQFGEPQLGSAIGQALSKAMQDFKQVRNYLAYQNKPVATMIAFEQNGILAGMLTTQAEIFTATLLEEAGIFDLTAYLFEITHEVKEASLCLERWSIQ
jgi:hypothetical protein